MSGDDGDHYEILHVPDDASSDDIRAAYRERARESHPDRNPSPDAVDRMQKINRAYEVLRDARRRAEYDRTRRGWQEPPRSERSEETRSETWWSAPPPAAPVEKKPPPSLAVMGLELLAMLYSGLIFVNLYVIDGLSAAATGTILVLGAIAFPVMWALGKRRASVIGAISVTVFFLFAYPLCVGTGLEQFVCVEYPHLVDEFCYEIPLS